MIHLKSDSKKRFENHKKQKNVYISNIYIFTQQLNDIFNV